MPTAPRKTTTTKPKTAAVKAEAEHTEEEHEITYASYEYKGQTYTVPSDPLDMPLEITEAETEYEMLQLIVGDDQWKNFKATKPTIRDFGKFSDLTMKAAGYGADDEGN